MLKDIYYARYYASIIGSNLTSFILLLPHPVKKVFDRKLVQRNSAAMKRGCLPTMNFLSISHHHTHTLTLYIQRIQKLGNDRRYTPPITRAKPCLSLMVNDNKGKKIHQIFLIHEENLYLQSKIVFHDSCKYRLFIYYYHLLAYVVIIKYSTENNDVFSKQYRNDQSNKNGNRMKSIHT